MSVSRRFNRFNAQRLGKGRSKTTPGAIARHVRTVWDLVGGEVNGWRWRGRTYHNTKGWR